MKSSSSFQCPIQAAVDRPQDCLTTRDSPHDQKGFRSGGDRFGQRSVGRFVGQILLAGEETQERPALLGDVVADGAAQHRVGRFARVQDRAQRYRAWHLKFHRIVYLGQSSEVKRKLNSNHFKVWASTESTAGRSRTMGVQSS